MSGLSPSKITIFTSNNDPSKRLKRPTQVCIGLLFAIGVHFAQYFEQILLTATLTDKGQKFDDQCPIVWQVGDHISLAYVSLSDNRSDFNLQGSGAGALIDLVYGVFLLFFDSLS
jgi:hypothetical protein